MAKLTVTRAMVKTRRPIGKDAAGPPQSAPSQRVADGLTNVMAALGTAADKRFYNQYGFVRPLTKFELENAYRSSWLAKRIVRTVADDMTREGWSCTWDGYDGEDAGVKTLAEAEKAFQVPSKVNEALTWGRLYGGAGIVIGIKGDTDYSKPLVLGNVKRGSLQFLHVLDRWRLAASGELDYDPESPNFGYPLYYTVSDIADPRFRVHWTRVIRFGGEPLPYWSWTSNGYWDDSVLQHVMDVLKDHDATLAAIASLVFEANVDIIKSPMMREFLSKKGGEAKLVERFQAAALGKSLNRILMLDGGDGATTKGEEYQQKTIAFSGLKDVMEKFMVAVCGAADIPMTRLYGQSPAGMDATGESDIRNYYDHVASEQESRLRPQLERLYEVLVRSTFGNMPKNFAIAFNPLWQLSDKEQAEIDKLHAERDLAYVQNGLIPEDLPIRELFDRRTYRTMEQDDVDAVATVAGARAGGEGDEVDGQPGGVKVPGGEGGATVELTPTAVASIVTVNEARRSVGLPPMDGPDGELTIAEYQEKHAETVAAAANAESGDDGTKPPAPPPGFPRALPPGAPGGGRPPFPPKGQQPAKPEVPANDGRGRRRGSRVGDEIRREPEGFSVYSEGGKRHLGGPYRTKGEAVLRLRQVEGHKDDAPPKNDGSLVVTNRDYAGFKVAVENPAGTIRTWKGPDGREVGHTPMLYDYGYLKDHVGNDMEELDVYLGPNEGAKNVYVVHQKARPAYDRYDEDKVFIGFDGPDSAMGAFAAHRNDGLQAFGGMSAMTMEQFRGRLKTRTGIGKIRA